jgi:methyltransferase FkbM-like protein
VEFGAYQLKAYSNVYRLWTSGWRALLIEGDPTRFRKLEIDYAEHPDHEGIVTFEPCFVTAAGPHSLDEILTKHGFPREVDFVSIDVDGIDLHIWRGLEKFRPRVVCIEYNGTVPPHIEYVGDPRGNNVGSSARAMSNLGREKGYTLVACIGWNAFFVEDENAGHFADAGDLEALFDYSYIRYAMQSYRGELFFSSPLFLPRVPLVSKDFDEIQDPSVPLGRFSNSPRAIVEALPRYYLRPIYMRLLNDRLRAWKERRRDRRERIRSLE